MISITLRDRRVGKLGAAEAFGTLSDQSPLCEKASSSRTGHSRSRSRIGGALDEIRGERLGDLDRLGVAADDMGGRLRPRDRRHAALGVLTRDRS